MGDTSYSKVGKASDVKTLNTDEQGIRDTSLQGVLNTANNYENLLRSLTGGLQGYETGISNAASNYDPTAATNQLMSMMPQMSQLANTAAAQSLSGYGSSAEQLAQTATRDALRSTAGALGASGLLNSGAANASLMEAALAPQQQMQTNLAQLQSQASTNLLNNLLSGGSSSLTSGYGQQGSQNLAAAGQNAQNFLSAMGLQSNALAQQGGLYGNLAGLTEQQYWQPQYAKDPGLLDYLTGAGSLLEGSSAATGTGGQTNYGGLPALLSMFGLG